MEGILPRQIGTRYVIFPSFFLFLMGASMLLMIAVALRNGAVAVVGAAAVSAAIATATFAQTSMSMI